MLGIIHTVRHRTAMALLGLSTAALLSACGGGGGADTGTLQLSMTDAPACGYDHVMVDVQKLRINQSSSASDSSPGWNEINVNKQIDLLTLTNGVLQTLGQVALPTGQYMQMRLVLGSNNTVTPTGGTSQPLTVPSGQQSGVKMNVDITIGSNQMADFVVDFNACKSIVQTGSSNYLLKPVVSVTPNFISGVNGYVGATLIAPTTLVSAQQAGVEVKATIPDSSGKFVLPVGPGTYNLVIAAPGHVTEVITGVTVTSNTVTSVNTASTGLTPAVSAGAGTFSGTVTTGSTPVDAAVAVTQTLSGGNTVVVAGGPVNAVSGAYSFTVPTDAPVVAAFVSPSASLAFAPYTAAAGKYSLAADSGGVIKPAGPFTVAAGGSATTNFTFP